MFFKNRIRHILLNQTQDGMWSIRDAKKKTIIELVEHLVETKALVQIDGATLQTAMPRPEYYILHEHIEVGKKLGGGAFGDVHIGIWKKTHGEGVNVAIKKLKGMMHKKDRCEFVKVCKTFFFNNILYFQEARIMRKFKHPNLVQLIGVAPNETPMMIVLELCPGGSLQSHLKKNPDLPKDKLTSYCLDACRGMCYLSGQFCIAFNVFLNRLLIFQLEKLFTEILLHEIASFQRMMNAKSAILDCLLLILSF